MDWRRFSLGFAVLVGLGCYPDSDKLIDGGVRGADGPLGMGGAPTTDTGRDVPSGAGGALGAGGATGTGGMAGVGRGGAGGSAAGGAMGAGGMGAGGNGAGGLSTGTGGAGSPQVMNFVGGWVVDEGGTTFDPPCPITMPIIHDGEDFEVTPDMTRANGLHVATIDCVYTAVASGNVATLDPGQTCNYKTAQGADVSLSYSSGSFTLSGNNMGTLKLEGMASIMLVTLSTTCFFHTSMLASRQ